MGVSLSCHGVVEIGLRKSATASIKEDPLPYEVWDLWIKHGKEEKETIGISLFVKRGNAVRLDEALFEEGKYLFKIHEEILDPEESDVEDALGIDEILPDSSQRKGGHYLEELDKTKEEVEDEVRKGLDESLELESDKTDEEMKEKVSHHPECHKAFGETWVCHPNCEKVEGKDPEGT